MYRIRDTDDKTLCIELLHKFLNFSIMIFISKFLYVCNSDWRDLYILCIMNIDLVNIYFQYIMLKFIQCDVHVQHLLLVNISFSNKNEVDISIPMCKAFLISLFLLI